MAPNKNKKDIIFFMFVIMFSIQLNTYGQDSIQNEEVEKEYVEQTFFSTRITNSHSVETLERGVLDVRLEHRMGRVSSGISELFGLNVASSQIGLEYGISNGLMAGINTNTIDKIYTGLVKYKLLRQSIGKGAIPLSITWFSNAEIQTGKLNYPNDQYYFSSRLFYTHQLILARKFSDKFSLQVSPTLVHKNMVKTRADKNNIFMLGLSTRYKIKRKMALTAEYNVIFPNQINSSINGTLPTNSLALGIDIYTGKHTFQFFITNSVAMNEKTFLTETTENIFDKGIHIGFNITRLFNIVNYYE